MQFLSVFSIFTAVEMFRKDMTIKQLMHFMWINQLFANRGKKSDDYHLDMCIYLIVMYLCEAFIVEKPVYVKALK